MLMDVLGKKVIDNSTPDDDGGTNRFVRLSNGCPDCDPKPFYSIIMMLLELLQCLRMRFRWGK